MSKVSQFVFFNEDSTESVSNSFIVPSSASALTLQVDAVNGEAFTIRIEGMNDLKHEETYHTIACIGMEDYKVYNSITKQGLYMIVCDGMFRVRLNAEDGVGNFKALAVSIG